MVSVRKAKISDSLKIKKMIDSYAKKGIMLHRPIYEIYGDIRNYFVAEINKKIVGCCSLQVLGREYKPGHKEFVLAEVRSLAVPKKHQRKGIGAALMKECIREAKEMEVNKVYALTIQKNIGFFEKLGFRKVTKSRLPQKIWQECIRCQRFPAECNEVALFLNI